MDRFEISRDIDIIDQTGAEKKEKVSYEIRRFDYLENLLERAIVGKKPETVAKLAEIVRTHNIPSELESYLDIQNWEKRLGFNGKLIQFLYTYNDFIKDKLDKLPFEAVLHCDAYPTNVLERGVIIDPKPLKRGNPMLDVSHFLESPKFIIRLDKFLNYYLDNLQGYIDNPKRQALKGSYSAYAIHNSICLCGAMLAQDKMEDAQYFLGNAISILDREDLKNESIITNLETHFIEYVQQTEWQELKKAIEKTFKVIKELKSIKPPIISFKLPHKKMNIGIDFDGVISDSTRLKIELARKIYNIDLLPEDCSVENIERAGLSREQYRELVTRIYSTELTLKLDEVPDARNMIDLLRENNQIHIITSRSDEEAAYAKRWLERFGVTYNKLINTNEGSKLLVCQEHGIDAFVDDTYKKLAELSGNGLQLYLFSTLANRAIRIEHLDIKRADNWEELYKILKTHR